MPKTPPPSSGDAPTAAASAALPPVPPASVTLALPPGVRDDAPLPDEVVWEDDFRQTVMDVAAGRRGVEQLQALMRAAHEGGAGEANLLGLAVLLEGVQMRLSAAVDGVVDASNRLGFAGAFDLPGVQA